MECRGTESVPYQECTEMGRGFAGPCIIRSAWKGSKGLGPESERTGTEDSGVNSWVPSNVLKSWPSGSDWDESGEPHAGSDTNGLLEKMLTDPGWS